MEAGIKKGVFTGLFAALLLGLLLSGAYARDRSSPYGTYKRGGSAESGYGEKRPVASASEARRVLEGYFAGKGVRVGKVRERELFFEADILGRNGQVVDRVIVDKRTGRIRSIY
jgi:hypothetical protein